MKKITIIKSSWFKTKNADSLVAFTYEDFTVLVGLAGKRSYYVVTLHFNGIICQEWTVELKGIEAANKRVKELAELVFSGDLCKQISINESVEKGNINQGNSNESCKRKSNRGGARVGSGRKKKQPSKLMRIPVRFEKHLRAYIAELEGAEKKLGISDKG